MIMPPQLVVDVIDPIATGVEVRHAERAHERYVFVDALRGVAASMVVMLHLTYAHMPAVPDASQSPFVIGVRYFGGTGVQIFFVISGFVIAHSLRNTVPSGRSISAFILRRQLRLDPAYWVTIAMALAFVAIGRTALSDPQPLPSTRELVANVFYFHVLTRQRPILEVAWTLCIEIQFYLVFILLLWGVHRANGRNVDRVPTYAAPLVLLTGAASLILKIPQPGWFTVFWSYFAVGVLISWTIRRKISFFYPLALLTAMAINAALVQGLPMWIGTGTGFVILVVGAQGRLTEWAGGAVLQYLGRISYSLYLVHQLFISVIHNFYRRLALSNGYIEILSLAVTVCVSIAVAHILHTIVEKPTMKLSHRVSQIPWAFGIG